MKMKIVVDTIQEKEKLLKESQYMHDQNVDSGKCNTLIHLFMNPDMIEVRNLHLSRKKQRYMTIGSI